MFGYVKNIMNRESLYILSFEKEKKIHQFKLLDIFFNLNLPQHSAIFRKCLTEKNHKYNSNYSHDFHHEFIA